MGNTWVQTHFINPAGMPKVGQEKPTFDPLYGWPQGRKERTMVATQTEMELAKVPLDRRDFCAHKWIDFEVCKRDNFPWFVLCEHERHEYRSCLADDHIHRVKEYERERRLLQRQQRREKAGLA